MTRFTRAVSFFFGLAMGVVARPAAAQDSTFRGVTLVGNYDPLRDKVGVVVMPISGAFGDSVRTILQRDLDYSDRFTVLPVDTTDPSALRAAGSSGLNYPLFQRLNASAIVQVTLVPTGFHVVLHDVGKSAVINVSEFAAPANGLSRDWRMAVHRVSDEVERWVTGQRGISASRIAYIRGTGSQAAMRIVDSDGADEITVPTDECGLSPAWNSSGTMLVYATCGAGSRVLTIDLATGRSRPLIGPTRNVSYSTPIFAPDGNSVIYTRAGENGSDLYALGLAAGEQPRRLTTRRGFDDAAPTMSPDGRRIVYVGDILGHMELYIMDADGTGSNVLTNYAENGELYRSDPDWSPDGRRIAYQERVRGVFQIRTIRPDGGASKYLTSEGENEQPSWAPDGRHLVFTSNRTGVRQLWVMDTESGRLRQLTKSSGSRIAAWSPRLSAP